MCVCICGKSGVHYCTHTYVIVQKRPITNVYNLPYIIFVCDKYLFNCNLYL